MSGRDLEHEHEHEAHEAPAPARRAPASAVAQLQRSMGNARLLQLRALQRRESGQAVNPMEFIQKDLEAKAAAGKYEDRALEQAGEAISVPSGGTPLPGSLQRHAESHLGVPMGDVQVVTNGDAATKPINALAFTTEDAGRPKVVLGSDVNLETPDGQFTLMHELTHVAQQKQGLSAGLTGLGGDAGQRESLEQHADAVAAKMCQGGGTGHCTDPSHKH